MTLSQLAMNVHAQAHELKNLLLVQQVIHSCELVKFVSSWLSGGTVQFRVQPYLGKFPVTPDRYT